MEGYITHTIDKLLKQIRYSWGSIAVAAVLVIQTSAAGTVLADSTAPSQDTLGANGTCTTSVKIPVALGQGLSTNQKVAVTYCFPRAWAKGKSHQIDVVTPGAGYNSSYWNWPQQSDTYSYTKDALNAGRAVALYDRIGTGQSSHPPSTDITLTSDAYVLHKVIDLARLAGYGRVNSVGHSYGSAVVAQEAYSYHDVSSVILTGFLHTARNPAVGARNYPANQDPMFASAGLDSGYLTSRPDTRKLSFYSTSADSAVIAYDEAHKDVISTSAFLGYVAQQSAPSTTNISNDLHVPVLLVIGQQDAIFCTDPSVVDCTSTAALKASEAPYYTAATKLDVLSVALTGHDLALHPSAPQTDKKITVWIKSL
jgi:pimeloyl-ACP methyl ester carboxylesterase